MRLDNDLYQHPKLVTVFGGSGFVGRHVVEALTKRGYRVRVAVRHPEQCYYMLQIGEVGQVQMLKADVLNRSSVSRALVDAGAAVFLPGLLFESGRNTFRNVQITGAKNVAELARAAGVQLIHMSALGADENSNVLYAKTKALGERAVLAADPDAIIMRPSIIIGPEDGFFNKFADLSRFTWFLPLFGGGQTRLQPVFVGDVAAFIIASLEGKVPKGGIFELGGKEVLTFKTAMEQMLRVIMRKKVLISVPFSFGIVAGSVLGILAKIPMMPKIATADQIKLLKTDNVVSKEARESGRTLQGVGIEPRAVEAVLPGYLWRFRPKGQFTKNVTPDWSR